jgi:hypothetical protein
MATKLTKTIIKAHKTRTKDCARCELTNQKRAKNRSEHLKGIPHFESGDSDETRQTTWCGKNNQ